jgi:hypothetical protein
MDTNPARNNPTTFTKLATLEVPTCLDSQAIQIAGPLHNIAIYVEYGIFCRDIVSLTYVVAVGFCIAGATQTMREAQYLGAGTLINEDGVFDAGLQAYQYFLVAAILACASNGLALVLSLMSRVNSTMKLWWSEHNLADLVIRVVNVGLDFGWIVLCAQSLVMYTPEPLYTSGVNVDCTATTSKFSCAISNAVRFKNVYAKLLDRADLKKDSLTVFYDSVKYDGPYFHDLVTNFAIVFGLRFALTFLISAWANYKPLYLLGVSRTLCDPLGCGDKGGRATSEHVECGWTLGGLWSKWSNNQLGALRNHDWVGATFFFVAYLVLSTGLNDDDVNGSFIPRRSVLEEYATTLKNDDVKTRFILSYKNEDDPHQPCAVKFPLFTSSSANSNIWDQSEMTLFGDFMDILARYETTNNGGNSDLGLQFDTSDINSAFTFFTQAFQSDWISYEPWLSLNQKACVNLATPAPSSIWLGVGNSQTETYYSIGSSHPLIPYDSNQRIVDVSLTYFFNQYNYEDRDDENITDGVEYLTYTNLKKQHILLDDSPIKSTYLSGNYFIGQQCCRVTQDTPTTFEGSLSQRFELYSILLFVGSLFTAISALAQLVALSLYNVRARPLSLVESDGGYTMTVA